MIERKGINSLKSYLVGPVSFKASSGQIISIHSDFSDSFALVLGSKNN